VKLKLMQTYKEKERCKYILSF